MTAAAVAVLGLTLVGCGPKPKGSFPNDDPRSAVAHLLRSAVGQGNGQRACDLLTDAARKRMDETAAGSCRNALNAAIIALPGHQPSGRDTGRAAEDLTYEATVDGDRATVTVSRPDGARMSFGAVRLSSDERVRDPAGVDEGVGAAVESDWRVDRGVEQLVEVQKPADPSSIEH